MNRGIFDMHCHIVPYVDDGAVDIEEAVRLLEMERQQGVSGIIATPHFRFEMFETPREKVEQKFHLLKEKADEMGIDLYLGCEFHANMEMANMLRSGQIATMAGSRYVLAEFSGSDDESYIRERVYSLIASGFKPILAHIERYEATYKNYGFIEKLLDMGAYMQVNADSILGKEGFGVKRFCKKLMDYDYLSFVGSDCHDTRERISRIGEAYAFVAKKRGEDYADYLFIRNPERIIKNGKSNGIQYFVPGASE